MKRLDAIKAFVRMRKDEICICGVGVNGRELYSVGHHPLNLYNVNMPYPLALSFGLALAIPQRRTVLLDGDGSFLSGCSTLSVIGNVEDFPDESRLASYLGIVPRVSNSNETEHSGRIHKRGSKLGRTALVQSALVAAHYSPYLKNFYERIKARGAEFTMPPTSVPGSTIAKLNDTCGNLIQLVQLAHY